MKKLLKSALDTILMLVVLLIAIVPPLIGILLCIKYSWW